MQVIVIGGGMIGQLVKHYVPSARVFDWRIPPPGVTHIPPRTFGTHYLWQPLPDLPCVPFAVTTHIDGRPATLDGIRAYKRRVGKEDEVTSDLLDTQFRVSMNGYLAAFPTVEVEYNRQVMRVNLHRQTVTFRNGESVQYDWLVSTIPLYSMLRLAELPAPRPDLKSQAIWVKVMSSPPDSPVSGLDMYVNYLTSDTPPYRYTDRNGERHFESLTRMSGGHNVLVTPGKIYAHPDALAIVADLMCKHVICFGRAATWQSNELAHMTAHRVIQWRDACLK